MKLSFGLPFRKRHESAMSATLPGTSHSTQPNLGMQVSTFENPMGIDGFEFVEFAAPEPQQLHEYFRMLGFVPVARHRTRKITNYRQRDCTFLINEDPDSFAAE